MIILICGTKLQKDWKSVVPRLGKNRIGFVSNLPQEIKNNIDAEVAINSTMFKTPHLFEKPSPWMIWVALHKMGVDNYRNVFLIGEDDNDERAALNAGIGFVHIKHLN